MALLDRLGFGRLRRKPERAASGPAAVPPGWLIYAVGDLHGRYDLLCALGDFIAGEVRSSPAGTIVTVFLGDYIDRGPHSFEIVNRLARGDWPTPIVPLLGNHEDILLRFLEDESILEGWRQWGAFETLVSYGVDVQPAVASRDYKAVQHDLAARMPVAHMRFLRDLLPSYAVGDYFFCHAGVKPGVPLDKQRRQDLIMIREPFLSSTADHGKIVVHGHTPTQEPVFALNHIGLDTGAYATGRLSAVALEGTSRRLITARA